VPAPLRRSTPPEVLAPAGGRDQLRAAIEAGADAVYFGLSRFNARARAANFDPAELPEIMAELHERGLRGFVTLNTLVFDEELSAVDDYLRVVSDAGVDALIVQDLGLCARVRERHPELPIHGSTQMTVTSAESAELAGRLGCERVVLGRELSIRDIAAIAGGTDLELEVFVHGALCVSYSGQCFSSEAWGGRSANRGQCAQACRLPYDLVVDGQVRPMTETPYLLSPQDLLGAEHVGALIDAGVASLKIEGRLKGPDYVAATASTYRRLVDAAWAGRAEALDIGARRDLEQVFSRGLTPGFLDGPKHQRLVRGDFPNKRGVHVGTATGVAGRGVRVDLAGPVKPGDGLLFATGEADRGIGGTVHTVLVDGEPTVGVTETGEVVLKFGPRVRTDHVPAGTPVWRTRDLELDARLQTLWDGVKRRARVSAEVSGAAGEPLRLLLRDEHGRVGEASSDRDLQPARNRGLDVDSVRAAIDRLGDTTLELGDVAVDLRGDLFLPVSAINRVRRAAADALVQSRRGATVTPRHDRPAATPSLGGPGALPPLAPGAPALSLLCRSREQVEAALSCDGLDEIAVDFLEVKGLGEAIDAVKASGRRAIAVSPRVLKPDEERLRAFLLKLGADAILVRSLGLLRSLLDVPDRPQLFGDFSLNAANRRTARLLMDAGLARLAPTHDLNALQLNALAEAEDGWGGRLEVIVHHHLPIFHTEHCVFARFLSDGDSRKDCGTPCEHHEVHLRGRDGHDHLVRADMGCRNTVFNAQAQSGLRDLASFVAAGYRRFRIELADHRPADVAPLVRTYAEALRGELASEDAWRRLRRDGRYGLTQGSLRVIDEQHDLKPTAWMR